MSAIRVNDLHKAFGGVAVLTGVDLETEAGSFTAILGSSGSGKTTLLRLLVGFERADHGTISIGERIVESDSVHARPEQRRIGYVPQEGSLFPHLTVEANVGFGLRRAVRRSEVADLLDLVGLGDLGGRYPHQLSGGQQQRVALARALAIEPELVLLDEPFTSLDTRLRAQTRGDVAAILRSSGTTAVLVTHDQEEALSFADSVAVLRDGRVAQHAAPQILYNTPLDDDLARFVGDANVIEATLDGTSLATPFGDLPIESRAGVFVGTQVKALVRPEQIAIVPLVVGTTIVARITQVVYLGHEAMVELETVTPTAGHRLVARTPSLEGTLAVGVNVGVAIRGPIHLWPSDPSQNDRAHLQDDPTGRTSDLQDLTP